MGHVIGDIDAPRKGSMQFWPRKRAKRIFPRIRNAPKMAESALTSFSGYKVGMTHVGIIDNIKTSITKGQEIIVPITILECPPISVFSIRLYSWSQNDGFRPLAQINTDSYDKILLKKLTLKSKKGKEKNPQALSKQEAEKLLSEGKIRKVSVVVHTNPKMTGIGKKKPEVMEIIVSGEPEPAFQKALSLLGKQVSVNDVFSEGEQIDIFSVTIGKGFQGSVKRFGIKIGSHKAEKVKRKAMSLGPITPATVSHRVPQHGQMGFHTRCDYNKWLLKIASPKDAAMKGGFLKYGEPKNPVLFIKGSIPGPKKRIIRIRKSIRPNDKFPKQAPEISYVSMESKQ
ncbi:MAG: 50S ribosomal protein L3 [Candidatus Nanoarchaeia archaeon]|nr:50S ribosomal protein L3 [Candidatus Nanoarchaeia archaeon]